MLPWGSLVLATSKALSQFPFASQARKKPPTNQAEKMGSHAMLQHKKSTKNFWLVVSAHLKNISQIGNLPQIGVQLKNV